MEDKQLAKLRRREEEHRILDARFRRNNMRETVLDNISFMRTGFSPKAHGISIRPGSTTAFDWESMSITYEYPFIRKTQDRTDRLLGSSALRNAGLEKSDVNYFRRTFHHEARHASDYISGDKRKIKHDTTRLKFASRRAQQLGGMIGEGTQEAAYGINRNLSRIANAFYKIGGSVDEAMGQTGKFANSLGSILGRVNKAAVSMIEKAGSNEWMVDAITDRASKIVSNSVITSFNKHIYQHTKHESVANITGIGAITPRRPLSHISAIEKGINRSTGAKQLPTLESGWFHGTPKVFGEFKSHAEKTSGTLENTGAIYLTKNTEFANMYTKAFDFTTDELHASGLRPNVRPVDVKINKVWDYKNQAHKDELYNRALGANIQKWGHTTPINDIEDMTKKLLDKGSWRTIEPHFEHLKTQGYDAIKFTEGASENMAVFNAGSIRSKFSAAEDAATITTRAVGSVGKRGIGKEAGRAFDILSKSLRRIK